MRKLCETLHFPYEFDSVRVARYGPYSAGGLHSLFGCGMDLDGRWRGLPALYAVAEN